jgi:segregation and condensation protein A
MTFQVDLNMFRGPLDLLLYLVRKHELDILNVPIAIITTQYLEYLEVLKELDVNSVGDFIALASHLLEIKSQQSLPRAEEIEEELEDPRNELVRQLLEYKKYRDAAAILEEQSRQWQQRFPRLSNDLPPRPRNWAEEPIREVELWDLVSAFGRILRESSTESAESIVCDDTPITVHMQRIYNRLQEEGRIPFRDFFQAGMHRSSLVSVFLASMELIRHGHALGEQADSFHEIAILPHPSGKPLELEDVSAYEGQREAS